MLALSLGVALSGVMLDGLLADGSSARRLGRLLLERAAQKRAIALIKADLQKAVTVNEDPLTAAHACSMAGRRPVLQMMTAAGSITYSVGVAPSSIWRGQVLMRCGPAYGLEGDLSQGGTSQNRVVLDGLDSQPPRWSGCSRLIGAIAAAPEDLGGSSQQPFSTCFDPGSGLVGMRLTQRFHPNNSGSPRLTTEGLASLGGG